MSVLNELERSMAQHGLCRAVWDFAEAARDAGLFGAGVAERVSRAWRRVLTEMDAVVREAEQRGGAGRNGAGGGDEDERA